MSSPDDLYFRARDGGAQVFRVLSDTKDGRLKLDPLAQVSLKADDIRVQGDRVLGKNEEARIRDWMDQRRAELDHRELDDAQRTIEAMQATAHWLSGKAADEKVQKVEDALLMAAHDLRLAIVRRKMDR